MSLRVLLPKSKSHRQLIKEAESGAQSAELEHRDLPLVTLSCTQHTPASFQKTMLSHHMLYVVSHVMMGFRHFANMYPEPTLHQEPSMNTPIKSLSNVTRIWLQFFLVAMLPEYTLPLSKIQLSLGIQVGLVTGSPHPPARDTKICGCSSNCFTSLIDAVISQLKHPYTHGHERNKTQEDRRHSLQWTLGLTTLQRNQETLVSRPL